MSPTNFTSLPLEIREKVYDLILEPTAIYLESYTSQKQTKANRNPKCEALLDARFSNVEIAREASHFYLRKKCEVIMGVIPQERESGHRAVDGAHIEGGYNCIYTHDTFNSLITQLTWTFTLDQLHAGEAERILMESPAMPQLKNLLVLIIANPNNRQVQFLVVRQQDGIACEHLLDKKREVVNRIQSVHNLRPHFNFAWQKCATSFTLIDAEAVLAMWDMRGRARINLCVFQGCLIKANVQELRIGRMDRSRQRALRTWIEKFWNDLGF